eukprot:1079012-Prorocentrum_minimum.AAC.1
MCALRSSASLGPPPFSTTAEGCGISVERSRNRTPLPLDGSDSCVDELKLAECTQRGPTPRENQSQEGRPQTDVCPAGVVAAAEAAGTRGGRRLQRARGGRTPSECAGPAASGHHAGGAGSYD